MLYLPSTAYFLLLSTAKEIVEIAEVYFCKEILKYNILDLPILASPF